MIPRLPDNPEEPFPPVSSAQYELDGLLAWGGDLDPRRLLNAYYQGIFPWYSPGQPILWWWPQPRTVIFPHEFHVSRRLRRILRQQKFSVSADTDFAGVIEACARPDNPPGQTWIDAAMIHAYCEMNRLGHAHSVEVWLGGDLVGGVYGISLGGVFFGESMFSRHRDASKVALAHLCRKLHETGFSVLDCQMPNDHLYQFEAREISGPEFEKLLAEKAGLDNPIPDWQAAFLQTVDW